MEVKGMDMKMMIMVLVAIVAGGLVSYAEYGYYVRRFEAGVVCGRQRTKWMVLSICFTCLAAVLFCLYGYRETKIISQMLLIAALPGIAMIDKAEQIIPNRILGMLVLARLGIFAADVFLTPDQVVVSILGMVSGAVFGSALFLFVRLFARQGIGMGDIKLFAVIGMYMGGMSVIYSMLASFLIAAVCGICMLARKQMNLKDSISFGPYIAIGTILVMEMGV